MSWLHDKTTELLDRVEEAKDNRVFPFFRPFENLGTRVKVGRKSYINFTSNDYLGLSQDPRLIDRAIDGVRHYGTGLGSARPQATSDRHQELEVRLAGWLGYQACSIFTTGYQGMVGVLSTFPDDDTTLVLDKLSHACIIDGAYLAQGHNPDMELRFFKHNSPRSLRRILKQSDKPNKMVVVEGLYSVDGDLCPLADIVEVCRQYDASLVVDDAHGIGTLGPTGRGVAEIHGVLDQIDFLFGSFSKSFGGIGGFVLADRELVEYLKLQARSFVYSATLPVAQIEAASKALDIIESDRSYFRRLAENRDFFRDGLLELGYDLGDSETHITPIMIGDDIETLTAGAHLYIGAGVIMMPFIYPGVPLGKARLRCNVTAAHHQSDMGYTLEALAVIGQSLGLIPKGSKTTAGGFDKARWAAHSKLRGVRNAGLPYLSDEIGEATGKLGAYARKLLGLPVPEAPPHGG